MREDFQARHGQSATSRPSKSSPAARCSRSLSQAHVEPDITMEIFFVDGPLGGFGAVEITEPELMNFDN